MLGSLYLKLDLPQGADGSSNPSGVATMQDITPSEAEYKNAEAGFGDDTPFSSRTYSTLNGSIGKLTEVEAESDLARAFLCDLDNTRPGQLSPWRTWNGPTGAALYATTPGGAVAAGVTAQVDIPAYGTGAIVVTTGGTDPGWWFYSWDTGTQKFLPSKRLNFAGARGLAVSSPQCYGLSYALRAAVPYPVLGMQGSTIWIPDNGGGMFDAATAYPQTRLQTGTLFWHAMTLGDQLLTVEALDPTGNTSGMTISLRDKATLAVLTPATLAGIPAPELGNAPIQVNVPTAMMCYPPMILQGAVYLATDREILKVVFDENACRLIVVPLPTRFTRVTSAPASFMGSLFVGSGNTLWRWTPGQQEFTPLPIDEFGVLPPDKGGGMITALLPTARALYVGLQTTWNANDGTLLRFDGNGVFTCRDWRGDATGAVPAGSGGFNWFVNTSAASANGPSIGIVGGTIYAPSVHRVIPIWESNADPSYLAAVDRHTDASPHYWLSPWDTGTAFADRKDLLRLIAEAATGVASPAATLYYQTDNEDQGSDTFGAGTLLSGQGTFHLASSLSTGNTTLSLTGLGLQYRRIRWAVQMMGDATGTDFPRLLGFRSGYTETPAKYVLHTVRVRIEAGDPQLGGITAVGLPTPPQTVADVYAIYSTLWGYAKAGTLIVYRDLDGVERTVKITKFRKDYASLDENSDGAPTLGRRRAKKLVITMALEEADSAA